MVTVLSFRGIGSITALNYSTGYAITIASSGLNRLCVYHNHHPFGMSLPFMLRPFDFSGGHTSNNRWRLSLIAEYQIHTYKIEGGIRMGGWIIEITTQCPIRELIQFC